MTTLHIEKIKIQDEVILEIREIKDSLARAFSYNIKKILAEARIRQKASSRTVLSPPAKIIRRDVETYE